MVKAGDYKHYVTLQQETRAKNAMGEWGITYATFANVWGAFEPLSGGLYYAAQQANSKVQGRFRMRFIPNVKPTMRILYQGRYFEILSIINPGESREELHLLYREKLD